MADPVPPGEGRESEDGRLVMSPGATISLCGLYRYDLRRSFGEPLFDEPRRIVNWVMLNPSTADASADDPTIRRCIGFAKSWGYSGLVVTNLFAFRATDPADMRLAPDPVGPDNDAHILRWAAASDLVVFAWGCGGGYRGRAEAVRAMLRSAHVGPYALKLTKDGHPQHPLYVPSVTAIVPMEAPHDPR